jgi:hypothetical protein
MVILFAFGLYLTFPPFMGVLSLGLMEKSLRQILFKTALVFSQGLLVYFEMEVEALLVFCLPHP